LDPQQIIFYWERDKETERQRDKETKRQRDRAKEKKRDRETRYKEKIKIPSKAG
jgi:hypothetical protein